MIYGEPFVGKSFLLVSAMDALTTNHNFLGRSVTGKPHRIAYLGTDPGALDETKRRLEVLGNPMTDIGYKTRSRATGTS